MHVLGRRDGERVGEQTEGVRRPAEGMGEADEFSGEFGHFLAPDGSTGGRVAIDLDRPHVVSVVGKRGSGKSYTLGVLAESLADARGVTGVVVDPMGVFGSLADVGARVVRTPRIPSDALPPRAWCEVVGLDPTSGPGALLWRAASETDTLDGMCDFVEKAKVAETARRVVHNHLALARAWECFGEHGIAVEQLLGPDLTVLDCSGLAGPALDAVVAGVASALYQRAAIETLDRLPWLLVDEAHVPFAGIAADALQTILTRGRQPGVSLALATQRPGALPEVALSQTDLLVAHRLTTEPDIAALARTNPTSLRGEFRERLPSRPGDALVVDDTAEAAHTVRVRERETAHGGASPRASERV